MVGASGTLGVQVQKKLRAAFVTVVPSPYQRDLFGALAAREDVELSVYYMEASVPDSPWPEAPLRHFEHIMGGGCASVCGARVHVNWPLPELSQADVVVLSTYSSLTGQWLMRRRLPGRQWLFWGERMRVQSIGWRHSVQRCLASPLAHASAIVGIGREAEQDYSQRYPGVRHFSIPYYCDLTDFVRSPRRDRQNQPLRFFFCGQMILRKGVDILLEAFDRLVGKGLDVELLLVGREAELPKFMEKVSGRARRLIRYEGFQAPEQLPRFFSQCDVFVLPSRHDGWGVVVNQAIGAGLPVIASDAVGAAVELVEPDVNGLCCVAGDADSLQQAMERLVRHPELVIEWGEASRRKAAALAPEVGAEQWMRVFNELRLSDQPEAEQLALSSC